MTTSDYTLSKLGLVYAGQVTQANKAYLLSVVDPDTGETQHSPHRTMRSAKAELHRMLGSYTLFVKDGTVTVAVPTQRSMVVHEGGDPD